MEGILLHTVEIAEEDFTIFTIKNNPGKFVPLCLSAFLSSEQNLKYTNYTDIFYSLQIKSLRMEETTTSSIPQLPHGNGELFGLFRRIPQLGTVNGCGLKRLQNKFVVNL